MTLRKGAVLNIPQFDFGLSYRLDEKAPSFRVAKNIMINQARIEKRYGFKPLGDSPPAFPGFDGLSFFKNSKGDKVYLSKSGPNFIGLATDGLSVVSYPFTITKAGKFRSVTGIDRLIIADPNGLFQFNGTSINPMGARQPNTPTLAAIAGTSSLDAGDYYVQLTLYSSQTGYESNPSSATSPLAVSSGQFIQVSNIDITSTDSFGNTNSTIDKVRIYLKRSTQVNYLFVGEIPLGTTTFNISANATSSQVPPVGNDLPPSGGVKYLANFNKKLVIAGIEQYPNEVWFSNQDDFESFDSGGQRLAIPGDGPVTAIAVGLYNNTVLDPYLVIFKKNKTFIYSEIGDIQKLVEINTNIGCASHDTIVVRNGDVYFLSSYGWYAISNGKIVEKDNQPYQLGGYLIGDIFESKDFDLKINRNQMENFYSVYFHTQDLYITYVCDNGSNLFNKAYVYHFGKDFFTTWEFPIDFQCSVIGEGIDSQEVILAANKIITSSVNPQPNVIYQFNKDNDYQDSYYIEDDFAAPHDFPIAANAVINWRDTKDYDASSNYRELLIKAPRGQEDINVSAWVNYTYSFEKTDSMSFPDPDANFTLDQSQLDVGILGEGREIVTSRADLNLCGESILIGFSQNTIGANMIICSAQLNISRNGNRNI